MLAQAEQLSPISNERVAVCSSQPVILSDIYRDDVNIAIWKHTLNQQVVDNVDNLLNHTDDLNVVIAATPDNLHSQLHAHNDVFESMPALCDHLHTLVDMFCTLFELPRVGLRLTVLNKAMCPKFHIDRIPCRLVSTLSGVATQWLPYDKANYAKLGAASAGKTDDESGIYQSKEDIEQLEKGDVVLLKGSGWHNNEHSAIVHRSPHQLVGTQRLVITLDFID